ncbi:MAG TPA: TetR/AcrR family transcriptional regulator [Bryobacteraceae bacterium]|jgi:AcrR family transcriptional regulator|nr:TetR/AcrR family transcriptional regulator [Bryobacteraceae bacterium]
MTDTKQRIFDAAERLIAAQGYSATSLRQIIAEAGVNLASVHYHFGSKEELLDELIHRKADLVNRKRLELLERAKAAAGPAPVPLVAILEAFLLPVAEVATADPQFVQVMGRVIGEGLMPQIVGKYFRAVGERFFPEIRRSVPELTDEEFGWRRHFLIGAMCHTLYGHSEAQGDFETRIGYLIRFLAAGFEAPAVKPAEVNA